MIVVSSKPGPLSSSESIGNEPASSTVLDCAPPYSIENLAADPEVCRRVGSIIAKGAERRAPRRPAPRGGSCSSTD
jgi:hypothetical protein